MVQATVSTERQNVYLGEHTLTPDELRAMDARIDAWASSTPNVPDLGALMQYEADTAAWLKAHGCTDTRCQPDSAANGARHADEDVSAPIVERLALSTPVKLVNGVEGVIAQRSSCSSKRYEVAWFDRHFWIVRRKWFDRAQFEVIGSAQNQTAATA